MSGIANEQNLKPSEYKLSQEEAKKGGINSGKTRRKKSDFQQAARWALEMKTSLKMDGKKQTITQAQAIVLNLLQKASSKNDKQCIEAAKVLIQLSGANKSEAERRVLEAQAAMIQAKADLLSGADTTTLDKLDSILNGMKELAENDVEIKPKTE